MKFALTTFAHHNHLTLISEAWGPMPSFFVGWNIMAIVMIDQALYPILFLSYLESIVLSEFTWLLRFALCFAFVAFAFFVTLIGTRFLSMSTDPTALSESGIVTNLSVIAVLLPLIIYCGLCWASVDIIEPRNLLKTDGPVDFRLYSSVLLWLYSGYDFAGFLASV